MEKLDAHSAEFRQFFLVHYETLCIRAFRLVHDRNLSEDIVQAVSYTHLTLPTMEAV